MELDKYLQNVKLSKNERETKYWKENYDKALENLMVIPVMDKQEIEDNQFQITRFKAKYPFYLNVIELIKTESDNDLLKSKIVNEILTYLDVVYRDGNIVIAKGNYNSISKKVYSKEKTSILTDLKMMLYEAILNDKIQNKIAPTIKVKANIEEKTNTSLRKKPGRKSFSEIDLIGLKYQIIRKFYESENPYSSKSRFLSIAAFQKEIGQIEKINPDSFKNSYNKIGNEDLIRYCKEKPRLVKKLVESNSFQNYPKCSVFISQFDTESN